MFTLAIILYRNILKQEYIANVRENITLRSMEIYSSELDLLPIY